MILRSASNMEGCSMLQLLLAGGQVSGGYTSARQLGTGAATAGPQSPRLQQSEKLLDLLESVLGTSGRARGGHAADAAQVG